MDKFKSETASTIWIKMPEINLDKKTCINCKSCIFTCPMGVYCDMGGYVDVLKPQECILCMGCVPVCPVESITIKE